LGVLLGLSQVFDAFVIVLRRGIENIFLLVEVSDHSLESLLIRVVDRAHGRCISRHRLRRLLRHLRMSLVMMLMMMVLGVDCEQEQQSKE